jgi:two-component system, cell cycle response regulator
LKLLLSCQIDYLSEWIQESAILFNFELISAPSPNQAFVEAAKDRYDLVIIVDDDPDAVSAAIKIKSEYHLPVALISRLFDEIQEFVRLKNNARLDYLLPFELDKEMLVALLRASVKQEEHELPEAMIEKFKNSICLKIERIEGLVREIEETRSSKILLMLKGEIHKVSGSAGSYGYGEVSKLCRKMEIRLIDYLDTHGEEPVDRKLISQFPSFMKHFKLNFQKINLNEESFKEEPTASKPKEVQTKEAEDLRPQFYLITEDDNLIENFRNAIGSNTLIVETSPHTAVQRLSNKHFVPENLIVDSQFLMTNVQPEEIIRSYNSNKAAIHKHSVLILNDDDVESRMKALELGVDNILKKPLTIHFLREFVQRAVLIGGPCFCKTLVVDDDEDFCELLIHTFHEIGFNVAAIKDETKVMKQLKEEKVHFLVLDINMPEINGWKLLESLRSDPRYDELFIIVVTQSKSDDVLEKAYSLGADHVIFKPINLHLLKIKMLNFANRKIRQGLIKHHDTITGFYTREVFLMLFSKLLKKSESRQLCYTLCLIELNDFEALADTLGEEVIDEVVMMTGSAIRKVFENPLMTSYFGLGRFALLFKGIGTGAIAFMTELFYEEARKQVQLEEGQWRFSYNAAGICFKEGNQKTPEELTNEVLELLKRAREGGESTSLFEEEDVNRVKPSKKYEVVIVDPDYHLADILETLFLKNNMRTRRFISGSEALAHFTNLYALETKYLLLIERNLPDMDGIDVLKKILQKFPDKIVPIFLSALTSDRAIASGLNAGALDYIKKPLNTEILKIKSLKFLEACQ